MSTSLYFLRAKQSDAIKIGITSLDPRLRLKSLQTGCPEPLELIGTCAGTQEQEWALHGLFASDCISGEWFRQTPALMAAIARLVKGTFDWTKVLPTAPPEIHLPGMLGELLIAARKFSTLNGFSLATVSTKIFDDGKRLAAIEAGRDIGVRRYDRAIQWLSDNWPANAEWPINIARPVPTSNAEAATP